jgi:hypothetical protein
MKPEFPNCTSGSRIVRFSYSGHNDFATFAGQNEEVLVAKSI